ERLRKELPRRPRLDSLPRGRDLEILLERCLAWEPRHRLSSAAKLADDLDRYRRAQRIQTKPLSLGHRVQRLAVGAATRSRWMFGVCFVAALGLMLGPIAWFFDVGWLVTGRCYQGLEESPAVVAYPDGPSDPVLIVGVFNDTVDAVSDFAAAHGIKGVTRDIRSWRGVHGRLMERLAQAGPKAVVWDYYFRTPQPGDAQLVAGIRTLEENGIPVVLASKDYGEDGVPDLSPTILQALGTELRHGAIVARDMVRRPGEFVMAIRSGDDTVLPSLALTTLAAVLHPNTRSHVEWSAPNEWIRLIYEIEPGAFLRERDRIEFTKTFKADRGPEAIGSDDAFACTTFPLDDPEQWERRTVAYQTLLLSSDEELHALVSDKVVIIGEIRRASPGVVADRHAVKYGTTVIGDVPGCYLLGDAIAGLLKGRYFRSVLPLSPRTLAIMLLAAIVGCLLPIRLATMRVFEQRSGHRGLWVTLGALCALSFVVMVVSDDRLTLHVGMAGFSMLAPMAGAFWVEFARNRHRILETHRRAIVDVTPGLDGTLTLAPTQLKSLRATG
ncbi:MAG: CHASE2 domain-containing protein, partial [Planctomycetes bacterium]|nr:CHASE2 domain-containing protein [Planctomycetota bacterium]